MDARVTVHIEFRGRTVEVEQEAVNYNAYQMNQLVDELVEKAKMASELTSGEEYRSER